MPDGGRSDVQMENHFQHDYPLKLGKKTNITETGSNKIYVK